MSQNGMSGSSPMGEEGPPPGPPYPPATAVLGGSPTSSLDLPITIVFMLIFICGAVANMSIVIANRRRKHKFIMTNLMFGFCMARTTTCVMRIVWIYRLENVSIGIAAQIFVQAGVILLIIVNLIFAQRLIRASYPNIGWHKTISFAFTAMLGAVPLLLIALITCVTQSFYTLDTNIRRIDQDVEHVGQTYFATAAFFPIPVILIGYLLTRIHPPPPLPNSKSGTTTVEKFGTGSYRTKVRLLLLTSILLTLGASFRAGTAYVPRPRTLPAWYHSKACFYTFNFTIEIIVLALYLFFRVDRRFHVADGARGPGDYARGLGRRARQRFSLRIMDEEVFFDFGSVREEGVGDLEMAAAWAKRLRAELEGRFERLAEKDDEAGVGRAL